MKIARRLNGWTKRAWQYCEMGMRAAAIWRMVCHTSATFGLVSLLLATTHASAAEPVSVVHVRGETHVSVHWQRELPEVHAADEPADRTWLRLEGQALDDAERPLASAEINLALTEAEGGAVPRGAERAVGCGELALPVSLRTSGQWALRADADGRFCLRLPLAVLRYHLHAEASWQPARYDVLPLEQDIDFGKPPLSLWLEGSDGKPDLGTPSWTLGARVGVEEGGRLAYAPGARVDWLDETNGLLASAQSDAEGHLRFEVATAKLGDPGVARHRLKCAGSAVLGAAELVFSLEKRAKLELVLEGAPGTASAGAELPYSFRVRIARAAGSDPSRQLFAPRTLVQASFGGQRVGSAETNERGEVIVPVLLEASEQSGELEFRATARVPFLLPSDPVAVPIEVTPPRNWRSLWLLGGFLVLVAWLAIGRAPPRRDAAAARTADREARVPAPRAEIKVTEERSSTSWRGSVKDAHDRTPVRGARLKLIRPGFAEQHVLAAATSESDGSFVLDGAMRQPGDRILVEAPLHRTLEVDAPAFGTLGVTTISRRRGLLHDFAQWAQGQSWTRTLRRKPTPLDAALRDDPSATWAARVDAVVFGPDQVDAAREASAALPGGEPVRPSAGEPPPQ